MTALKLLLSALALVCIYFATSEAQYQRPPPSGKWGPWGKWCPCTKKCRGKTWRTRKCLSGPYDPPCKGISKQIKSCNTQCAVHGGWGRWGPYSKCSKSCRVGVQYRYRKCNKPRPQYGGKPCRGRKRQARKCNKKVPCSVRVGFRRTLYRVNEGSKRVVVRIRRSGDRKQTTTVRISVLPGGSAKKGADFGPIRRKVVFKPGAKLAAVSIPIKDDRAVERPEYFVLKLSSKDKSVALIKPKKAKVIIFDNDALIGFRGRRRTVRENRKKPFTVVIKRVGALKFKHTVSVRSVDGTATSKAPNADYVRIRPRRLVFGPNVRSRKITVRILDDKLDEKNIEFFSLVLSTRDRRVKLARRRFIVRIKDNDVNGKWGKWGPYSKCSKSCRYGTQTRKRSCNNPKPSKGAQGCKGPSRQTRKCNYRIRCPVNGGWSKWGPYTKCSKSCRYGMKYRYRTCTNPRPRYGGKSCRGPRKQRRKCNYKIRCPVDGGWGRWGPYSKCSKSCRVGVQYRYRKCNKPRPQYGGKRCRGRKRQARKCNKKVPCSVRVGFRRTLYRVNEGSKRVVVRIRRSGDRKQTTTVRISVLPGGSAKKGADFGPVRRKVVFKPGAKLAAVSIPIKDDRAVERPEYFVLKLSSKDKSVALIKPKKAKVIIFDNDALIGFRGRRRTVRENRKKPFTVVIKRVGALKFKHTVSVRSVDGTATSKAPNADYVRIRPTKLIFGPNVRSKKITVTILDDKLDEKDIEFFSLLLSTRDRRVKLARRRFIVRIKDNDVVNGKWGPWGPYGRCSKKCGGGVQRRRRKCNNPPPGKGGKKCSGPSTSSRKCNTKCCKVNGGFGPWSKWGTCRCVATPYGPMVRRQVRYRKCNKPKPSCGGKKCYGKYKESRKCTPTPYAPPCTPYGK